MKPLPAACREFLLAPYPQLDQQSAANGHTLQCRACADHVAFRDRVAPLLRSAPPLPGALRSPRLLQGVHERIVAAAEQAPLGRLVAIDVAPRPPEAVWPEQLLDTALAAAVRAVPPPPSAVAWNAVRRSILATLATPRRARVRAVVWLGVAATALLTGLLLSDGTLAGGTTDEATIVFADLQTVPGNEFAVLRYGALR